MIKNTKIEKIQDIKKKCQLIIYINVSQYNGSENENYTFETVLLNMFETSFLNVCDKKKNCELTKRQRRCGAKRNT